MGVSRIFSRETQTMHFQRDSIPFQSAICWATGKDEMESELVKGYYHNFGDQKDVKSAQYTSMIL